MNSWDRYFHTICEAISLKSPCLSRHIGAILVKDHSIVSTGFNGPSRGIPHCGRERNLKDTLLITNAISKIRKNCEFPAAELDKTCPRRILEYESGTGMQWCPAQHAEENAISNAARLGVSVLGSTLYMNAPIPCKNCYGTLINAGIVEIVVDQTKVYDEHTQYLIDNSDIKIRRFEL
jgi:dCMP deaminase